MPRVEAATQQETAVLHGRFQHGTNGVILVDVPVHVVAFETSVLRPRLVRVVPKARWYTDGSATNAGLQEALYQLTVHLWNQRRRNRVVRHAIPVEAVNPLDPPNLHHQLEPGRHWDITVTSPNTQLQFFSQNSRPMEIELTVEYDVEYTPDTNMHSWTETTRRQVRCRKKAETR